MFDRKIFCSLTLLFIAVPASAARMDPYLAARLAKMPAGETTEVIVRLIDLPSGELFKAAAGAGKLKKGQQVIRNLKDRADRSRQKIRPVLERERLAGTIRDVKPVWIVNGLLIKATAAGIQTLAGQPEVASIRPNTVLKQAAVNSTTAPVSGWNLHMVHAPELWARGFSGQGTVVASFDSGVELSHPALTTKWRGGSNSWHDPYRSSSTPYDPTGHGTATTGLMVGGDTNDNLVGVAPGAKWIAAKIFDDSGNGDLATIHAAFQWALDPDGDETTADAPDLINNSWDLRDTTGLYDDEFQPDIDALRVAGIAVVFAAGNQGPIAASSTSPGNNPGVFPVGSVDSSSNIEVSSSRGPSAANGSIYPMSTAPGVNVRSSDILNSYAGFTGTSFAAPHLSGTIALIKSALPELTLTELETALQESTVGKNGPDNTFGYGRLDALKTYSYLQLPGDVNGDGRTDMVDVLVLLNAVVSEQTTPLITRNGAVSPLGADGSPNRSGGTLSISDVLLTLQKALGIISW